MRPDTPGSPFPPSTATRARHALLLAGACAMGLFGAILPSAAEAQAPARAESALGGPGSANYPLAARFAPYRIQSLVHSTSVNPRWIEDSDRFWYTWQNSEGTFYYIVDAARATRRPVFDNDRIAAELTRITLDPYDGQNLPIRSIRFLSDNVLEFEVESSQDEEIEEEEQEEEDEEQEDEIDEERQEERRSSAGPGTKKKVHHFEFTIDTQTLRELHDWEAPDNHPSWANISPDGQTVLFGKNFDIYMMSGEDYDRILEARRGKSGDEATEAEEEIEVTEIRLTEDGEEHYSYTGSERGSTDKTREEEKDERKRVGVSWSHDSRRFALVRSDQREVEELWVIHSVGNDRPELESYRYDMPGDENVTQNELRIYDLDTRMMVDVATNRWQDEGLSIITANQFNYQDSEEVRRSLWVSENSDELFFYRISRDRKKTDVMVADATTGESRVLFEDRLNTYMETQRPEFLANGDILWWSERDGWAHIYRYTREGTLRNRLTEGPFSVRQIVSVDEENGVVYFQAAGREEGEDPYYEHLYRVNLDGSDLRLLNEGHFDHRVSMDERNRFFVENRSRVNTVPQAVLRNSAGRELLELETADFSGLEASGWQMPEPFQVKAADGRTDLYGVMYKPFDFDPSRQYPIIAYVYPGPQTESVAKSFSTSSTEVALAQFGFIVITVGNRGGHPSRSKWYHNFGYGNLRDYGLADKKATIEQLADRHDFVDMERVGIYGHSGGGFMSTAAMLVYPDFFKVAVSSAGNHDNDVYNRWWSETHHGVQEVTDDEGNVSFEYEIDRNSELADNLKGHLLLTTGEVDNNVHPAGTLRMADALIRANKRFDFFVFPRQRHGFGSMNNYWFWLRAEYFVKHLLDDHRWSADILQLQVESPQTR